MVLSLQRLPSTTPYDSLIIFITFVTHSIIVAWAIFKVISRHFLGSKNEDVIIVDLTARIVVCGSPFSNSTIIIRNTYRRSTALSFNSVSHNIGALTSSDLLG